MTEYLEVGRVSKSHGVRGDVIIAFTTDRVAERTEAGTKLMIGDGEFTVLAAQPHGKHHLVKLSEVNGRDEADLIRGQIVQAEAVDDPDAVFVHEVIGAQLIDQHGTAHGTIVSVLDNPASDLMELDDGRLVPFVFLVSTTVDDQGLSIVRVDVPIGLLDDGAIDE